VLSNTNPVICWTSGLLAVFTTFLPGQYQHNDLLNGARGEMNNLTQAYAFFCFASETGLKAEYLTARSPDPDLPFSPAQNPSHRRGVNP